jgi:segregation and condensation protein B
MTTDARRALEAILMVADQPVPAQLLAEVTETPSDEVPVLLAELAAAYEADGRGFVLAQVAGGWRFQSHPDLAGYVERFVLEGQSARLSAAALETLAIVAYKQPLSRAQIAAIRGVNVDGVVRTLEQRGYIAAVGNDPGPGQATLLGTTPLFLERLGLNSLSQLPPIADFVPDAHVVEALEHGLRADAIQADEDREEAARAQAAEDLAQLEPTAPEPQAPAPEPDMAEAEAPEPELPEPGVAEPDVAEPG